MTSKFHDDSVIVQGLPALLALHKALLEAKLHPAPENSDVAGSPFVADIANTVFEALVVLDEDRADQWRNWRQIDQNEWVKDRVVAYATQNPRWNRLSDESKRTFLRCATAPFSATAEQIEQLLEEANRRLEDEQP